MFTVTIIDADPNQPLTSWAELKASASNLQIRSAGSGSILPVIDKAQTESDIVIVDLEGRESKTGAIAVSRADLVVIPMQASQLDANQAAKALGWMQELESAYGRRLPHSVLMTRTPASVGKASEAYVKLTDEIREAGLPVFKSELNEREVFRRQFTLGLTVFEPRIGTGNAPKQARTNAQRVWTEVSAGIVKASKPSKAKTAKAKTA
jgi:chromosome partitioning protein